MGEADEAVVVEREPFAPADKRKGRGGGRAGERLRLAIVALALAVPANGWCGPAI